MNVTMFHRHDQSDQGSALTAVLLTALAAMSAAVFLLIYLPLR